MHANHRRLNVISHMFVDGVFLSTSLCLTIRSACLRFKLAWTSSL